MSDCPFCGMGLFTVSGSAIDDSLIWECVNCESQFKLLEVREIFTLYKEGKI